MNTQQSFLQVQVRVNTVTGWRFLREMADFLGITPQSISGAKERGNFPVEWAFKIAQAFNTSTDWLLTGEVPSDSPRKACCPYLAEDPLSLTTMDQGNLERLTDELRNVLDRQERLAAESKSLLKRIARIIEKSERADA